MYQNLTLAYTYHRNDQCAENNGQFYLLKYLTFLKSLALWLFLAFIAFFKLFESKFSKFFSCFPTVFSQNHCRHFSSSLFQMLVIFMSLSLIHYDLQSSISSFFQLHEWMWSYSDGTHLRVPRYNDLGASHLHERLRISGNSGRLVWVR